ncbi:MAG: Fis family transcriptional regulator [Chlamydiota bacterium]
MMSNKHIGSSFDDFLKEEEIFDEVEAVAAKRVFVFQMKEELKKQHLNKSELAKKMHTSRSAVNRVLDPQQPSTVLSLSEAAHAVGKHLNICLS